MWDVTAQFLLTEARKGTLSKAIVDGYFPYLKRFSKSLGRPVDELIPLWEQAKQDTPEIDNEAASRRFIRVALKFMSMVKPA